MDKQEWNEWQRMTDKCIEGAAWFIANADNSPHFDADFIKKQHEVIEVMMNLKRESLEWLDTPDEAVQ